MPVGLQLAGPRGSEGRLLAFDIADRGQCRERLEADIAENGSYYGVVLNAGIVGISSFGVVDLASRSETTFGCGPANETLTLVMYIYAQLMKNLQVGYASAVA